MRVAVQIWRAFQNRGIVPTRNSRNCVRNFAVVVENVPILGESITEGEIAEWSKEVGETVDVDDVVAIVETDKVSVEIKSPFSGILMEKLADLDATISVGAPLYKIDTDGEASVAPTPAQSSGSASSSSSSSSPSSVASAPVPAASSGKRVPLIKFLGKRSLLPKSALPHAASMVSAVQPVAAPKRVYKEGTGVAFTTLEDGAWFGRPQISEMEMDAIDSGVSPELEKLFPAPVKKR